MKMQVGVFLNTSVETVRLLAAAAHSSNDNSTTDPLAAVESAADDEESRTNVDESAEVKVDVSVQQTAAPPAGLLSPRVTDKPQLTANGPTSSVITRPRLSRTLDLSINRCVETSTAVTPTGTKPAPSATNVRPTTTTQSAAAVSSNVRISLREIRFEF